MDIQALLKEVTERDGSDLHLKVNQAPVIRVHSRLEKAGKDPLRAADLKEICSILVPPNQKAKLDAKKEMDFTFVSAAGARFRTNIFWQRGDISIVMRYVKNKLPSFEELHLPEQLLAIAEAPRGITLLAGPTGSGKSTSLAALIDHLNAHSKYHIVTVEDPIEYVFEDKESIVNQREVGIDTETFADALKYVLRQDPDVIVIGEMRDAESFLAALSAAETGHLVFSTLHTSDAASSVTRILEFFPPPQREQIRMMLAQHLNAIVCQRLLPRADNKGVVPAVEILVADTVVRKLIRENKIEKISDAIDKGMSGMQSFNKSLVGLVKAGLVSTEEALANASNPETLKLNLQGIFLDEEKGILNL